MKYLTGHIILLSFLLSLTASGASAEVFDIYCDEDNDSFAGSSPAGTFSGTGCLPAGCQTSAGSDCDDNDPDTSPAAEEIWYDGADRNCDGWNDFDRDMDTYVDSGYPGEAGGTSPNTGDCNDSDPGLNPGTYWYADADIDTFGDPLVSIRQCTQPSGYVLNDNDCNDSDPELNPDTLWYSDVDNDSFGNPSISLRQCSQPPRFVLDSSDCNDFDPEINPDTIWYADMDNDSFGNPSIYLRQCSQPPRFVLNSGDCNDLDPEINPDTLWYSDMDNDSFGNPSISLRQCSQPPRFVQNSNDCDDSDHNIYPGGPPVRVIGETTIYYHSIQEAYNNAGNGDVIQDQGILFNEFLVLNRFRSVRMESGYDCGFKSIARPTSINDDLVVNRGSLTIQDGILWMQ